MTMADWKEELNRYLTYQRAEILEGKGKITRKTAEQKIESELSKNRIASPIIETVDRDFVEVLSKKAKEMKGR